MQKGTKKLRFEFNNSIDTLMPSMQLMSKHIADCLPANSDNVLFRSKAIIIELLTNAIKHAGVKKTVFDIEINEHTIIITKTDQGAPLGLIKTCAPILKNGDNHHRLLLSADPLNSLYASCAGENSICFTCEENLVGDCFHVEDMMEHFGMLIISRSANEFIYTYDKHTRSNIFKAELVFLTMVASA